jgi:hypothetical protein
VTRFCEVCGEGFETRFRAASAKTCGDACARERKTTKERKRRDAAWGAQWEARKAREERERATPFVNAINPAPIRGPRVVRAVEHDDAFELRSCVRTRTGEGAYRPGEVWRITSDPFENAVFARTAKRAHLFVVSPIELPLAGERHAAFGFVTVKRGRSVVLRTFEGAAARRIADVIYGGAL